MYSNYKPLKIVQLTVYSRKKINHFWTFLLVFKAAKKHNSYIFLFWYYLIFDYKYRLSNFWYQYIYKNMSDRRLCCRSGVWFLQTIAHWLMFKAKLSRCHTSVLGFCVSHLQLLNPVPPRKISAAKLTSISFKGLSAIMIYC